MSITQLSATPTLHRSGVDQRIVDTPAAQKCGFLALHHAPHTLLLPEMRFDLAGITTFIQDSSLTGVKEIDEATLREILTGFNGAVLAILLDRLQFKDPLRQKNTHETIEYIHQVGLTVKTITNQILTPALLVCADGFRREDHSIISTGGISVVSLPSAVTQLIPAFNAAVLGAMERFSFSI